MDDFLTSLVITIFVYSVPIAIYRYLILMEPIPKKKATKIVVIYAIVAMVIMCAIKGDAINLAPLVLWSCINRYMLITGKSKRTEEQQPVRKFGTLELNYTPEEYVRAYENGCTTLIEVSRFYNIDVMDLQGNLRELYRKYGEQIQYGSYMISFSPYRIEKIENEKVVQAAEENIQPINYETALNEIVIDGVVYTRKKENRIKPLLSKIKQFVRNNIVTIILSLIIALLLVIIAYLVNQNTTLENNYKTLQSQLEENSSTQNTLNSKDVVYATKRGEHYHDLFCDFILETDFDVITYSKSYAVDIGLTPCPKCNP